MGKRPKSLNTTEFDFLFCAFFRHIVKQDDDKYDCQDDRPSAANSDQSVIGLEPVPRGCIVETVQHEGCGGGDAGQPVPGPALW